MSDARLDFPATRRNAEPIFGVLSRVIPACGVVLEIGSGSGQHAVSFAPRLPGVTWQPTDPDPAHRASIDAWRVAEGAENVLPALHLDALAPPWPVEGADALLCCNVIHISPPEVTQALFVGAARLLPADGPVLLYGPFKRGGEHTAPSNAAFDESLRSRDARWGVRDLDEVAALAEGYGVVLDEVVEMPANNLSVVFRKRP